MNNSHHRGAEQWRQIIGAQRASGLSIAAYCRDRRISQPSFFAWKRRLAGQMGPAFVEVTAKATEERPTGEAVEICLSGQRRLLVRRGFDHDLLIELVRVLEGVA